MVIVGGIYYLTREEKIELSLKNKKEIFVEYGNTVQYSFDDLIQTKDIDKDKLKEIKKEIKMNSKKSTEYARKLKKVLPKSRDIVYNVRWWKYLQLRRLVYI